MPSHCCEMSLIYTFKKLASAHKIQTLVSRFPPSHTLCEQLSISNDPQSQHNHNMDCRQYAEEEAITGCRRDKAKIFSTVRGRRSFPHHHTWLLPLSPCCEDQERGDQIKTLDLHQCSGQDWPKHWIHNPFLIVYIADDVLCESQSHHHHILCESESHMYMNPLIHHYYWARGLTHCWLSGACPIMWTADQFFFFREIFFIIITILVTEPPSIISIVILNSVPLERADVANMGGGDWRRGHPLNTQCALQCHGIQQTTLHFSVF